MSQGTDGQLGSGEPLLDAVVFPVETLALVRDDQSGDVTLLSLTDTACKPLVLSGTAAVIWDELDGRRSLRTVVRELATDYELEERVIGEQVLAFVAQLLDAGLLRRRDSERDVEAATA